MAERKHPTNQSVSDLQVLLEKQEKDLVSLRDERNRTIRKLHKAKLDLTKPSDEILKFAANAGPMVDKFFDKSSTKPHPKLLTQIFLEQL